MYDLKPGAFYPLEHSWGNPHKDDLDLDEIFGDLAERVARYVLPENYSRHRWWVSTLMSCPLFEHEDS